MYFVYQHACCLLLSVFLAFVFHKVVSDTVNEWWIFNNHFIASCPQNAPVKKFWKSVIFWWRCGQKQSGTFFWPTRYKHRSACLARLYLAMESIGKSGLVTLNLQHSFANSLTFWPPHLTPQHNFYPPLDVTVANNEELDRTPSPSLKSLNDITALHE